MNCKSKGRSWINLKRLVPIVKRQNASVIRDNALMLKDQDYSFSISAGLDYSNYKRGEVNVIEVWRKSCESEVK